MNFNHQPLMSCNITAAAAAENAQYNHVKNK